MAYGDFVDLPCRTTSDKVLRDKVFNTAENLKHDGSTSSCFNGLQSLFFL